MSLKDKILAGDQLALSRFIRDVDDGFPETEALLKELSLSSKEAFIIGVTGSPGSGKSSLISKLIGAFRADGKTVGVIAVDPTSPFSGGAILGDRIRMTEHNADPGVFIKSVATRGAFGGLSKSVVDILRVMEASGKEIIIIETVGVGQDEVDIFGMVSQVLVVTAPGQGDDIQAIKAGLTEIADCFVVNKRDLPGAAQTMMELGEAAVNDATGERKPIILTDSIRGDGIASLVAEIAKAIERHSDPAIKREQLKKRYQREIEIKARGKILDLLRSAFAPGGRFESLLAQVGEKKRDPYAAVAEIIAEIGRGLSEK